MEDEEPKGAEAEKQIIWTEADNPPMRKNYVEFRSAATS